MIIGEIKKYEQGKPRIYRYRYVNNVPMRETEPSLMVNWYEVEIFDTTKNQVIYKNSFITNHELSEQNIFKMRIAEHKISLPKRKHQPDRISEKV